MLFRSDPLGPLSTTDSSGAAINVDWMWQAGGWTNTIPPAYGYEVTHPSSLSHPSERTLAPGATAAQHHISILEPQSHVVAVRPRRGGEMTSQRSRERCNMIQVCVLLLVR